MKTIITRNIADPNTKYPLPAAGVNHFQEGPREAIGDSLKGLLSGNTILWGMTNSTPGGTTYTLTAGAIFGFLNFPAWSSGAYTAGQYVTRSGICYIALNNNSTDPATDFLNWIFVGKNGDGQVFRFLGQTITVLNVAVIVPVLSFASVDPVTFTDGNPYSVHSIVTVAIADQLTGTGISDFSALSIIRGSYRTNDIVTSGGATNTDIVVHSFIPSYQSISNMVAMYNSIWYNASATQMVWKLYKGGTVSGYTPGSVGGTISGGTLIKSVTDQLQASSIRKTISMMTMFNYTGGEAITLTAIAPIGTGDIDLYSELLVI